MSLSDSWQETWTILGLGTPPSDEFTALLARYAEPGRAYHTLQHLEECLERFEGARSLADRPGEVLVALWYHDAIYDTHAIDNEERSAELAGEVVRKAGGSAEQVAHIGDLIRATRHAALPSPGDAALLADIDLGILGEPAARFEEYEDQVRREYAWVPDPVFRANRARILEEFLARPAIFTTAYFAARYEATARENLARSLSRLNR